MTRPLWFVDLLNPRRVLGGDRVVAHCNPEDATVISAAPEAIDLLALALPYVEVAADEDHYGLEGKLRISVLADQIRATINKAEGKDNG